MTPREYEALLARKRVAKEGDDYRTAAIICATYNVWRDSRSDPLTPADIIGKKKKETQSPEDMLRMVKSLHATLGGKAPVE
jgi:hypothetical protein